MEVCRSHSHVIPTETFQELDDPAARLREISLLQQRAHALEHEIVRRKQLEIALRDALRERNRGELPPDSHKRLERVIVSGVRMQRMVEQLLDVTRARHAGGIAVTKGELRDLVPLVAKVVDEIRLMYPGRTVDLRFDGPCMAVMDGAQTLAAIRQKPDLASLPVLISTQLSLRAARLTSG